MRFGGAGELSGFLGVAGGRRWVGWVDGMRVGVLPRGSPLCALGTCGFVVVAAAGYLALLRKRRPDAGFQGRSMVGGKAWCMYVDSMRARVVARRRSGV